MSAEHYIEGRGQRVESQPREHELVRFIPPFRGVVITARTGTGQSNAGRELARRSNARLYDGGRILRDATGNTPATTGYMPRPQALDSNIDKAQTELLSEATPENPVIIVAKRGLYNAFVFEREHPGVKIAKVLLTCGREEAARRIYNRILEQIHQGYANAAERVAASEITNDEFFEELESLKLEEDKLLKHREEELQRIILEAQKKEAQDKTQWATMYPETANLDIYDTDAKILVPKRRGKTTVMVPTPMFDFHFNTTHRTKYQSVNYLVDRLVRMGAAEILPTEKKPDNNAQEMTPGEIYVIRTTLERSAGDQPN